MSKDQNFDDVDERGGGDGFYPLNDTNTHGDEKTGLESSKDVSKSVKEKEQIFDSKETVVKFLTKDEYKQAHDEYRKFYKNAKQNYALFFNVKDESKKSNYFKKVEDYCQKLEAINYKCQLTKDSLIVEPWRRQKFKK